MKIYLLRLNFYVSIKLIEKIFIYEQSITIAHLYSLQSNYCRVGKTTLYQFYIP